MNTVVFPDGLIVYSMYRCVPVLSVLLCLCEDYELFGIVVLPMWRSALPSSQSPPRRQFSNREPVWHGATLLKLRMTRASQPFVTSDAEAFAPDTHTLNIAKRLQAKLKSQYTLAEFMSDMPHGTSRHNNPAEQELLLMPGNCREGAGRCGVFQGPPWSLNSWSFAL